jgi:predicted alpha/beta hydrolase family esterase
MKNKKQVIFVPGFSGVDTGDWPDWLAQELTKAGFDFKLLPMPDVMFPEVHEWLDFLHKQKIEFTNDTYFIGHSLGCITIARYLENLPTKMVARACIFVAGFCDMPQIPLLADFCRLPLDFSKVKKHSRNFFVISSDDDCIIPQTSSKDFALKLGAELIIEHNKGHFTSSIKELHSVLNIILESDQMRQEMRNIKSLKRLNK